MYPGLRVIRARVMCGLSNLAFASRAASDVGWPLPNGAERQRLSAKGAGKPGLKVDDVGPLRGHP